MKKFKCEKCGSDQLGYQMYTRCIAPITLHEDDGVYFGLFEACINESIDRGDEGFICLDCGSPLEHHGWVVWTEEDLVDYLKLHSGAKTPQQRESEEFGDDW